MNEAFIFTKQMFIFHSNPVFSALDFMLNNNKATFTLSSVYFTPILNKYISGYLKYLWETLLNLHFILNKWLISNKAYNKKIVYSFLLIHNYNPQNNISSSTQWSQINSILDFFKFGLVCWVLWHINLCWLFHAKSILCK